MNPGNNPKDIVIVGAGPAGIAAAIQLKRSGIDPVLYEKNEAGGLLINANIVENYPGFPDGIRGKDLVRLFKAQMENNKIELRCAEVISLDYFDNAFVLKTMAGCDRYKRAIIASGTSARKLQGLNREVERNIAYEIYPTLQVRDKKIIIIGAGDQAFDYALNLAVQNEVTILNRGKNYSCIPLLYDRAVRNTGITYRTQIRVNEIEMQNSKFKLKCIEGESEYEIGADHVLAAIGREPQLGFLGDELKKNSSRLISEKSMFMAGDVQNGLYRQVSISVGDGIKAAMDIYTLIRGEAHAGSR